MFLKRCHQIVSTALLLVAFSHLKAYPEEQAYRYQYPVDVVDPSPQNNPVGAKYSGFRGLEQLVVYTPAFGPTTQTKPYGIEVIVSQGLVNQTATGNSMITHDGFVLSGHGKGANWLKRFAKIGAQVKLTGKQLEVTWTQQSDWQELNALAQLVEKRLKDPSLNPESQKVQIEQDKASWKNQYETSQKCLADLKPQSETPVLLDSSYHQLIQGCQAQWQTAFYKTVPVVAEGFRGVWLRPMETTPETVQAVIDQLKVLGIQDIFLETYYQGKTIYPSGVMKQYQLAEQHPRFAKQDPLKVWLTVAHQNNMRLHVWFQTYMAGNQLENAEKYGPILTRYPQWSNIQWMALQEPDKLPDAKITPVASPLEEGHYFLDPANPEVSQFLLALLNELVKNYEIDGVNLDYIRYPASLTVTSGDYRQSNWGYSAIARKRFQDELLQVQKQTQLKEKMKEPIQVALPTKKVEGKAVSAWDPVYLTVQDPLWRRWIQWRQAQVTHFVGQASAKIRALNPRIAITAVVFPPADAQLAWKLQDWPSWVEKGYLDALTPIGLNPSPDGMYQNALTLKKLSKGKVPIYSGIFGAYNRLTPLETMQQVDAVQRAGLNGIILFDGARVTPPYQEALLAGPFRNEKNKLAPTFSEGPVESQAFKQAPADLPVNMVPVLPLESKN
jgi:uncharacterized lipoprotein YddW (UPF0748 family)